MVVRIFVVHNSSKKEDEVLKLENLLERNLNYKVESLSLAGDRRLPDELPDSFIAENIFFRIKDADIVFFIPSMHGNHDWIEWELSTAQKLGKGIICVKSRNETSIPQYVNKFTEYVVGWNTDSINSAIENIIDDRRKLKSRTY